MKNDNKNLFLAIALSMLVVFAWQFFVAKPQIDRQRQMQGQIAAKSVDPAARAGSAASLPPQTAASPPQGGVMPETKATARSREDALAQSPRVAIDTPRVSGSIALKGGLIDDLALKDYRETLDKNSPRIVLLSPPGASTSYFVQSGFIPEGDVALPGPDTLWTAPANAKLTPATPLTLTFDNGKGLVFTRQIAIDDNYMFTVTNSVANKSAAAVSLRPYSMIIRHGLPPESQRNTGFHEGFIGYMAGHGEEEPTYKDIDKQAQKYSSTGGWAGLTDKYWATTIVPGASTTYETDFYASGSETDRSYQAATTENAVTVAPGASVSTTSHVFAGAKEVGLLDTYEHALGIPKFGLLIDWGWMYMIAPYMFYLLDAIFKVVGNMGVAIICTTLILKLVFFPLANRSFQSMAKMKAVQPQLAALKERFPDDKMKQQQEMMEIYKREKINPLAGCLPVLIQIPIFFSLYKVLYVTIEMRQAPFALWIRDLSQPDPTNVFNLFGLIPFNPTTVPVFGHFLALGVLPLVMGFTMFLQMKMNPEPTDPVQKTMFTWMPVVFTFMLGGFPSGLILYYSVNNTLTLLQQSFIMRRSGVKIELFDNVKNMFRRPNKTATPAGSPAKGTKAQTG